MALEDLEGPNKFINALNPNNPASTDDRAEGDDHIRGTKNVTVNSFPQISGPVSASHLDLSQCAGATSNFQQQIDAIVSSVAANDAAIAANAANISSNQASIATNSSNIGTNASDIAALDARITALEGGAGSGIFVPARSIVNTTEVILTSTTAWVQIPGLTAVVPAGWTSGNIMASLTLDVVGVAGTSVTTKQIQVDIQLRIGATPVAEFNQVIVHHVVLSGNTVFNGGVTNMSQIIAANAGEAIAVFAKLGDNALMTNATISSQGGPDINPSILNIMPVDITG